MILVAAVKLDTVESAALESTEAGLIGVLGQSVPKPVKLGFKREHGNAHNQSLETEENHVKELRENNGSVTRNHVQLTEVGQIGVDGIHVVNLVELVFKNVPENARNQRPKMAGKLAKEKRGKTSCAICQPALLTEVGRIGVNGVPVVSPVEVSKNVLGTARVQRPVLAGSLAKEKRGKLMSARNFAETYSAVCKEQKCHKAGACID
ncbi:hypothetical protein ACROYT_G001796 [Oculina patagonica]